jgi:ATP-dependent Clp endopeptidase proteolytic subunit ClpP
MKPAPTWYAISTPVNAQDGQSDSPVEITIYDEIGGFGVLAKQFTAELKKYRGQHIDLRINSVGGSVIEGDAIFNALRRHRGGLTVHVDGLAASMASVIAMAGDKIVMADNALLMIHNPWSLSVGDAADLRKEADTLDKIKDAMVRTYARRANLSRDAVSQMMDEEKWMDAHEALELGFIDEIDEHAFEAAASITRSEAQARFDKLKNTMARKPAQIKAEEAAPEVVAPVESPVVDEAAVDTSEEVMTAELQAKVDALQADLDAKNAAEAAQAQASEDTAKEIESLKAEVERLAAESAGKDEEIVALRAASKSAGEQAAAIVASVGIDAVAVQPSEPELTAAQKFAALDGAEATEFFRAHKREIFSTYVL